MNIHDVPVPRTAQINLPYRYFIRTYSVNETARIWTGR